MFTIKDIKKIYKACGMVEDAVEYIKQEISRDVEILIIRYSTTKEVRHGVCYSSDVYRFIKTKKGRVFSITAPLYKNKDRYRTFDTIKGIYKLGSEETMIPLESDISCFSVLDRFPLYDLKSFMASSKKNIYEIKYVCLI